MLSFPKWRAGWITLVALEATTGMYLLSFEHLSRWYLGWMLAHVVVGIFLSLVLAVRTLGTGLCGLRRWGGEGRFLPLAASLALLCLTGTFLSLYGGRGIGAPILSVHVASALFFLGSLLPYAVRLLTEAQARRALLRSCRRPQVVLASLLALLFVGFAAEESRRAEEVAKTYLFRFGPNPFAPGNARTSSGTFVDESEFVPASYCAGCHQGAHEQWLQSAHRSAFREPFYKKNVELFIRERGIEFTRHCESCHNPIALLSGALTPASTAPRPFDDEGVTCTVCHSITKISLEGTGSYEIAPPVMLFAEDGSPLKSAINRKLVSFKPELHKKAMLKDFMRTPEFCAVCHKSALPREIENYKWRRPFSAYDEWQMSSHSGESLLPFYRKPRNTCQSCHMKPAAVQWDIAADDGKIASHRWAAANTAIAFFYGFSEQLKEVEAFLQADVMAVDIFALWKGAAYPTQRDATDFISLRNGAAGPQVAEGFTTIDAINASLPSRAEGTRGLIAPIDRSEFALAPGETVTIGVVVSNPGVGHFFATEVRDFYEPWLDFKVEDDAGRVIFHSGSLDENGHVERRAHIFESVQVTENGKWVRHHNIWETRGKAYDNFVPAGRSELVRYQFTIPPDARGGLRVTARLLYRRFNRFYTDWVLGESVDYPIVEMASKSLSLKLGKNVPKTTALGEEDKIRFNNLGIGFLDQFLYPQARQAFERTTRIDPEYADGYVNQAITVLRRGRFAQLRSLLEKALEIDPRNARALYYLGTLFRLEKHPKEAAAVFEVLRTRFPRDRLLLNQLGLVLLGAGEYSQARQALEEVLEIDPDDITALWNVMEAYRKLRLPQLAEQTRLKYVDRFEDWRIHYIAGNHLLGDDAARAEAIPWHVHADVDIPTPKSAGPSYWISDGLSRGEPEPPSPDP